MTLLRAETYFSFGNPCEIAALLFIIQTGGSLGGASNGHVGRQRDQARLKKTCVCARTDCQTDSRSGRERACTTRGKKASREGEPAPIYLLAPSRQVQRYGSLTRSIFYFGLCALIKLQAKCPRRAHNPALTLTQLCKPNVL